MPKHFLNRHLKTIYTHYMVPTGVWGATRIHADLVALAMLGQVVPVC